jgi:hypothetical protein
MAPSYLEVGASDKPGAVQLLNVKRAIEMETTAQHAKETGPLTNSKALVFGAYAVLIGTMGIGAYAVLRGSTKPNSPTIRSVTFEQCSGIQSAAAKLEDGRTKDARLAEARQCFIDANAYEVQQRERQMALATEEKARQFVRLDGPASQNLYAEASRVMFHVQSYIKSTLRDPSSAQFKDMTLNMKSLVVCGQYNAKNGFGGYVGFKPFIMSEKFSTPLIVPGEDMDDFVTQWKFHCQ